MKKTAIMGFGNPVRNDDFVGCYVLELLKEKIDSPDVNMFDMGTSAFEVLFQLKTHQQIIVVDAVINSDEPDGSIFKLPASEIDAQIIDDPMVFLHSLKWDQALSYTKKIMADEFPKDDIYVYLIAVSNVKLGENKSPEVIEAAHKVVDYILTDLNFTN